MLAATIDVALDLLLLIGLPALFVFFVLKGAIVGKPLPTTILLPGYVIAVSASWSEAAIVVLTSSVAYVTGQMIIYYGARREGEAFAQSLPRVEVSDASLARGERLFARYGGASIFLSNFVPYLRGLLLLPAGVARYSPPRVVFYAYSSTLIYHAAVVAIGVGAFEAIV